MNDDDTKNRDSFSLHRRLLRQRQQQSVETALEEHRLLLIEATRLSRQHLQNPIDTDAYLAQHQASLAYSRISTATPALSWPQRQGLDPRIRDLETAIQVSRSHLTNMANPSMLLPQSNFRATTNVSPALQFLPQLHSLDLLSATAIEKAQAHTRLAKSSQPQEDLLARTKQTMVRKRASSVDMKLPPISKKMYVKPQPKNAFPLPPLSEEERRPIGSRLKSYKQLWKNLKADREFFIWKVQQARIPIARDMSVSKLYSIPYKIGERIEVSAAYTVVHETQDKDIL